MAADPFADLERDLQALPPGGDARTFHHGLSTALRRYLARRLSAPLLESTTRESNEVLRRQGMPDDSRREVVDLLALSDEARFAQRAVAAHRRQKRRARARRAARGVELWCRRREEAAAAREAQQRRSGP